MPLRVAAKRLMKDVKLETTHAARARREAAKERYAHGYSAPSRAAWRTLDPYVKKGMTFVDVGDEVAADPARVEEIVSAAWTAPLQQGCI